MVTGAAGSIGSELVRQLCRFSPRRIVLLDHAETPLWLVRQEVENHIPTFPLPLPSPMSATAASWRKA